MTEDFKKVVRIGTLPTGGGGRMSVFCKIEYKGGRLSITGVEGPRSSGNASGSCGQIDMHLREAGGLDGYKAAPGWSLAMVRQFLDVWDRWHLNDTRAGSPDQEEFLRVNPISAKYPESHYEKAREVLAAAGLDPDPKYQRDGRNYKYGSALVHEEVPADVLAWLQSLPDTDIKPAWV